jgi:phosphatidylserine/phosphatidylglycerophosphate/cardiolipin synthase-like enzyme
VKAIDVLSVVDGAIGGGVEGIITRVHRRRLSKVNWRRAYDPPGDDLWAAGDPLPRPGNALDILVDGDEAFAAMLEAIRGARVSIDITGWHANPSFALDAGDPPSQLLHVLSEAASRVPVRVLLWAGAPGPLFRPSRGDMKKILQEFSDGSGIRCALDARERPMHCHHDKTMVIDDRLAFVGGIDVTDFGGNRLDSPKHPARDGIGWHDAAARLTGPAVQDVGEHFRLRWHATTGESLPAAPVPAAAGKVDVQVIRTVPDGMYRDLPRGDFRILESYIRALRSARQFIYLENQFLWSPEILSVLREKLRRPPGDGFRLVVLLPARANSGADDTRGQLGTLMEADAGAGRVLACTLVSPNGGPGNPVYVHAKIGIVDDRWLTLGSANLNEHSLFNDTEVNIVSLDEGLARDTRQRLWAEHLEVDRNDVAGDPTEIIERLWRPTAREQLARAQRGERPTHRLTLLPGISKHSALLLGPLQGLTVDA